MSDTKGNLPEELEAELLGFILAGRVERVADAAVASQPEPVRAALPGMYDALAALALGAEPVSPSAGLRSRLMASVAQNQQKAKQSVSALLVVDMIMDHLTPGRPLEVPRAREIVPAMKARIEEARKNGVPVIYVIDEHEADDADLDAWGAHAIKGSGGNDVWPELAPKAGDRIVKKPTYSAFTRSSLSDLLDDLNVDTLVLTGCLTEIGVLATATDALQRGFAVEVPADSQAGNTAEGEQMTLGLLKVMAPYGAARKQRLHMLAAR